MSVRAKTKRRLIILLAALVLVSGVLGAGVVYQLRRNRLKWQRTRDEAIAACQRGAYASAAVSLGQYLMRPQAAQDIDARYYYAQALRNLPASDGLENLRQAVAQLRRVVEAQPERAEVWRELLELNLLVGYNTEAVEVAERLLREKPKDPMILRDRARAYARLRQEDKALADSEYCNEQNPGDLETQCLTLALYRERKRKDEILPRAEAYWAKYPDDGRGELLMSVAYGLVETFSREQREAAWALAKKVDEKGELLQAVFRSKEVAPEMYTAARAAGLFALKAAQRQGPGEDEASRLKFIELAFDQLNRAGLYLEATAVLDKMKVPAKDMVRLLVVVRRLWESNQFNRVVERLEKLEVTDAHPANVELMGLKATALVYVKRGPEAVGLVEALKGMKSNKLAAAWGGVVQELLPGGKGEARALAEAARGGLALQRRHAYFHYYLGEAYTTLGERNLAINAYRQAIELQPLWAMPRMHLSKLLLESGQPKEAKAQAQAAVGLLPAVPTIANLAVVWAANLDGEALAQNKELASWVAQVQQLQPGEEQTLMLHVTLLARTGERQAAEKVVREALGSESVSQGSLLRLAGISRAERLGLEEACYKRIEEKYGQTPDLAFSRAAELHGGGKTAEAIALFEAAMKKEEGASKPGWRMAWASLLDRVGDSRAAQTWVGLGDDPAMKDNLTVQYAALLARAVQGDKAFVNRCLERVRALTGEQAVGWRLARVRLLLSDRSADPGYSESIKLLNEIVAVAPMDLEARLMLAGVLEQTGNVSGAVEQFSAAAKLQPETVSILMDLARIHQAQQDYPRAREVIDRMLAVLQGKLAAPQTLSKAEVFQVQQMAQWLAQQGQSVRALELLEKLGLERLEGNALVMLAELYRNRQQYGEAEAAYAAALKQRSYPAIISAADFYASRGRSEEAMKQLQKLDELKLAPGLKEMALAEHLARHGSAEKALEQYRAVAKVQGSNGQVWTSLVSQLVRMGRIEEALAATEEAMKAAPKTAVLATVHGKAELIRSLLKHPDIVSLLLNVLQNPTDSAAAIEVLEVVKQYYDPSNPLLPEAALSRLRQLAERAPRLMALNLMLVQQYRAIGRLEEAAALATRAMKASPTAPELAQLAALVLREAGQPTLALAAANQWRDLSRSQPMLADVFIAELHLQMRDLGAAMGQLQPHLAAAQANPVPYEPVLLLQGQMLLMQRQTDKAAEIMWPVVEKSPRGHLLWLQFAQALVADPAACVKWLERITPVLKPEAAEEQIRLANAWHLLGVSAKNAEYQQRARTILGDLARRDEKNAEVVLALASMAGQEGRAAEAEAGYRKALSLNPDLDLACNNLAMLLAEQDRDVDEALRLARKAAELRPGFAAYHDTVSFVLIKKKDLASAVLSAKKAMEVERGNPQWMVNLASLYEQAGQAAEARELLGQIDALYPDRSRLVPEVRGRLEELDKSLRKTAALPAP